METFIMGVYCFVSILLFFRMEYLSYRTNKIIKTLDKIKVKRDIPYYSKDILQWFWNNNKGDEDFEVIVRTENCNGYNIKGIHFAHDINHEQKCVIVDVVPRKNENNEQNVSK